MIVKRDKLTFWERLYLPAILGGFKVTLGHFGRTLFGGKTAAKETAGGFYPETPWTVQPGYRGAPYLVSDQDGDTKCVSCQLCEFVCPPKAIRITPGAVPADQPERAHVEKAPAAFDIDMLRCIYCGLCQEVCPEEAIWLQNQFSMSGYSRGEMVNNKERLYELGGTLPDAHLKWDKKKAAETGGQAH